MYVGTNEHIWGPQTIAQCLSLLGKVILRQSDVGKGIETWI